MATVSQAAGRVDTVSAASLDRFGGWCAALAGVAGFLYSVAFIILKQSMPATGDLLSGLFLMLGGVFASAALLALYERLRATDAPFARWAVLLGVGAAAGSLLHGGYDLANAINPPAQANLDLPSPVDPRGLLTFGVAGIALLAISYLVGRTPDLPRGLAYLGYLSGALLIWIYLGRLIILAPTNLLIVVPALLAGFIVNPAWYLWLGATLLRGRR